MNTIEENIVILDSFLKLKYDWNDHGADPFLEEHIESVKQLIKILDHQPEIFPTAAHGIHLEYDQDDEVLIFDYKQNNKIKYFRRFKDGKTIETSINIADIKNEINDFYSTK